MKNEDKINIITGVPGYYDRTFDENGKVKSNYRKYKKILFQAGDGLQSAEVNEMQDLAHLENRNLASAVITSGDFISGGAITNSSTELMCSESVIYVAGYYVDIPARNIPFIQGNKPTDELGIVVTSKVVTPDEDPSLLDPAVEARNYNQQGALRLAVTGMWKLYSELTTEERENFNKIYNITEGNLDRADNDLPWEKSVKSLVARYDRNANGNYIIDGYQLTYVAEGKPELGEWKINISEGNANIYGYNFEKQYSQIISLPKLSDVSTQQSDTYTYNDSATGGWYAMRHFPLNKVTRITGQKTVVKEVVTHGNFVGASDPLKKNPVVSVEKVEDDQGKVYTQGVDFNLVNDQLQWLGTSNEPSPGGSYKVTYRYSHTTTEGNFDVQNGKTVGSLDETHTEVYLAGFTPGTPVYIDYEYILSRVDKIYIDRDGIIGFIKGEPREFNPTGANIDLNGTLLELGSVKLAAYNEPVIEQSTLKVYKMSDIGNIVNAVRAVEYNVSKLALKDNIRSNQPTSYFKNMLVDDFNDNSVRDMGRKQNAQCIGGNLILDIDWENKSLNNDFKLSYTLSKIGNTTLFEQDLFTRHRQINEFTYVKPPEAHVTLSPAKYTWVEKETYQEYTRSVQNDTVVTNKTQNLYSSTPIYNTVNKWATFGSHVYGSLRNVTTTTSQAVTSSATNSVTNRESLNTTSSISSSVVPYDKVSKVPQFSLSIKSGDAEFDSNEQVDVYFGGVKTPITITANSAGTVDTTVTTPEDFYSGYRSVSLVGKANKRQGTATLLTQPLQKNITNTVTEYWRYNVVNTQVNTVSTVVTTNNWYENDPTAQTFTMDKDSAIESIDIYFGDLPVTPVTVVLCETSSGVPNPKKVINYKTYNVNQLDSIKGGSGLDTYHRFTFDVPRIISKSIEYAIIVICDDNVGTLQIAKLGERDNNKGKWVYSNAYTTGTLLHSSNLKAWTPIQDEDMRFRLNSAKFDATTEVTLGSVDVAEITDFMLLTSNEVKEGTVVNYYVKTRKGGNEVKKVITPYTQISLEGKYTGKLEFSAELKSTITDITPYIDSSIQVSLGKCKETSEYISRAFEVSGATFDCYLDYYQPTGTKVELYYDNGTNPDGSKTDGKEWILMNIKTPAVNNTKQIGSGWIEAHYVATGVNITPQPTTNNKISRVKIKLITTSVENRPVVSNLRFTVQQ